MLVQAKQRVRYQDINAPSTYRTDGIKRSSEQFSNSLRVSKFTGGIRADISMKGDERRGQRKRGDQGHWQILALLLIGSWPLLPEWIS